jgi:hypothetical protein
MEQDSISYLVNSMIEDLEVNDAMAFLKTHEEKINKANDILSQQLQNAFNKGILHCQNGNV